MEKLSYSGRTSSHSHKFDGWESKKADGGPAVRTATVIEAQWSTMPIEVYEDVQRLWRYLDLGNDNYYWSFNMNDYRELMASTHEDRDDIDDDAVTLHQQNGPTVEQMKAKLGIPVEFWLWGETEAEKIGWVKDVSNLPYLSQWLEEQNFDDKKTLLLHYWW